MVEDGAENTSADVAASNVVTANEPESESLSSSSEDYLSGSEEQEVETEEHQQDAANSESPEERGQGVVTTPPRQLFLGRYREYPILIGRGTPTQPTESGSLVNRNRPESSSSLLPRPTAATMASKTQEQSTEVASQGTNEGADSTSQSPAQTTIVGSASTSPAPLDGHNVQASNFLLPRPSSAEIDQPEVAMGYLEYPEFTSNTGSDMTSPIPGSPTSTAQVMTTTSNYSSMTNSPTIRPGSSDSGMTHRSTLSGSSNSTVEGSEAGTIGTQAVLAGFTELYGGAAGLQYSHQTRTIEGISQIQGPIVLAPGTGSTLEEAMRRSSRRAYREARLDKVNAEDLHLCQGGWLMIKDCKVGHRAS